MTSTIVPIRIESVDNLREHWSARAKRAREQRQSVWYAMKAAKMPYKLPCTITLTRIAPRQLDSHDNLRSGCKASVDAIADWLDLASDADPKVTWQYAQERGKPKEYALKVEIA